VTHEEGARLARDSGCLFYETSARSGHNVERCFVGTAEGVLGKIKGGVLDLDDPRCGVRKDAAERGSDAGGRGGVGGAGGGRTGLADPKKKKKNKDCC
jgi:hypothetical protein